MPFRQAWDKHINQSRFTAGCIKREVCGRQLLMQDKYNEAKGYNNAFVRCNIVQNLIKRGPACRADERGPLVKSKLAKGYHEELV